MIGQQTPSEPVEMETPRVSVLMLTYNHAAFIDQAVQSVLDQQCSFPFEVVIGDDASTDGTLERLRRFEQRRPGQVRVLAAERNLGVTPNYMRTLAACRGEYVAMLEGDDYWTDTRKLQLQADRLEQDPSLTLCACRTANRTFWAQVKPRYELDELLRRYLFHTSALLFRRAAMAGFPVRPEVVALDTLLIAHLAAQGGCGFIDREMSYYRRHAGGVWSGMALARQAAQTQAVTDALSAGFNGRKDRLLFDRELWIYRMMAAPDLSRPVFAQWRAGLVLTAPLFRRIFRHNPAGALLAAAGLWLLPLRIGLLRMRRALGLRTRLAQWRERGGRIAGGKGGAAHG